MARFELSNVAPGEYVVQVVAFDIKTVDTSIRRELIVETTFCEPLIPGHTTRTDVAADVTTKRAC